MGNIVLLDDLTINQIAAGEVIERPASVVKELVENSIDAGANNISVEIRNGGISYIRITDNGKGILPDDMEIAFERHATSKIRKAEDLETVKSMGFRGEALASIAAISRVEMMSKTEGSSTGYKIIVEGGNIISKEECGCPKGTTITVQNLFYNTPVRYKFLKKDFTEFGYIEDTIARIALINPNISLKLINSGKNVIQTSGNNDMKTVVYNIYGKDISQNILQVDYTYEDIKVTGVVGKPTIARSNRSNQLFFVNKRYVKDKVLSSAAEQAFKGLFPIGKYGFLILNLEVDPHKVDVNVHPAKLEVRFEDESKIFKAVYHAIKETLLKENIITESEEKKSSPIWHKNDILSQKNTEKSTLTGNTMFSNLFKNIMTPKDKVDENSNNNQIINDNKKEMLNEIPKIGSNEEINVVNESKESANKEINIEETGNKYNFLQNIAKQQEVSENKPDVSVEIKGEKPLFNENAHGLNEIVEKVHQLEETKLEEDSNNFDEMYSKMFGILPRKDEEQNKVEEDIEEYHLDDNVSVYPQVSKEYNRDDAANETINIQPKDNIKSDLENISLFSNSEFSKIPIYKFIGIAFSTNIIIEMDKQMYIIDSKLAYERVIYEKIKKNFYSTGQKESQIMLLPDIITLSYKQMAIAKDNLNLFKQVGFTIEEFGENTIKISGVPDVCVNLEIKDLFLETLDEINTVARTSKQEIEEKLICTIAKKAAERSNVTLRSDEIDDLMNQLLILENPFVFLNGKQIAIKLSKEEIERKFSRR